MIVNRRCPFCKQTGFTIQRIGTTQNLFWLICGKNTTSRLYVEYLQNGRFRQVSVNKNPPPRTRPMSLSDQSRFNKLQTPWWKMMGQKPKQKDIEYEKMLKWKNMSYGDAVLERSRHGEYQNAMPQLEKHLDENR